MKKEEIEKACEDIIGNGIYTGEELDITTNKMVKYINGLLQLQQNQTKDNWISVGEKPDAGKPVLILIEWESVSVENGKHIKRDVLRARWIPKHFEIDYDNFSGDSCYDEKTDEYYWPEGWYETNRHEEINWMVDEKVLGWQPLPEPPVNK